ncbi:uncharacterized protein [Halyomorpha halys]|uniref:uncharacterized protein n=1 Tax=Halyomorpha halys TaxID=286706 RepID=UPI0034D24C95
MVGTKKIQTTAYRPSSNGRVGRFHRTLMESVSHYVNSKGNNWDLYKSTALAAYRSSIHRGTGYTPNFLTYGRELTLPFECDLQPRANIGHHDFLEELTTRLNEAYLFALRTSRRLEEQNARRINQGRRLRELKAGDLVYIKNITPLGKCRKFAIPWNGPFRVIERLSPVNYKIERAPGKYDVMHIDRLKFCPLNVSCDNVDSSTETEGDFEFDDGPEDEWSDSEESYLCFPAVERVQRRPTVNHRRSTPPQRCVSTDREEHPTGEDEDPGGEPHTPKEECSVFAEQQNRTLQETVDEDAPREESTKHVDVPVLRELVPVRTRSGRNIRAPQRYSPA